MPGGSGVGEPDVAAVFPDIGDEQDLGTARQAGLRIDVDLDFTKAPGEGDLLLHGDVLAAKEDHPVAIEDFLDAAEGRRVEFPRQVHAPDFGAQRRARWGDAHARGGLMIHRLMIPAVH